MAFQDEYSKPVTRETRVEAHRRSTILPFFGFGLSLDSKSQIDSYGGNTYVTKVGADTYKVSQSDKGLYTRTKYFLKWHRKNPILTDRDLETKLQAWLKKNGFNDIWSTPYICPTPEEFHQINGYGPKNGLFNGLIVAPLVIGVLLSLVLLLAGGPVFALLPDFLQSLKLPLCALPFVECAQFSIVFLIIKHFYNKKHRAKPLKDRDEKYQDAIRRRYYSGLVNLFGEEIGNSMKELSVQREEAQK